MPTTIIPYLYGGGITSEQLLHLADFRDDHACAVSFYFNLASTPDNSHRQELIAIKRLIQENKERFAQQTVPDPLLQDFEELQVVADEIALHPARLKAVFACREKQLWQVFDLPAPRSIRHLDVGRRFHLFPLLAAVESCVPYCVLICETGKSRVFVVSGTDIREIEGRLPTEDLSLHAQDSRVGWSKRVDRSLLEHEKAYFKKLSLDLRSFMAENQTSTVVIGCREDLWGEVERLFDFDEGAFLGLFHLPNFAIEKSQVVRMAIPIFEEVRRQKCSSLLAEINENPRRAKLGVSDILRDLSEGRVRTLVLSKLENQTISECTDCGRTWAEPGQSCIFCAGTRIRYMPAEEALIRQALLTDATILTVETASIPGFSGAAALLRY